MPVALIYVAYTERLMWFSILLSFTARICAPLNIIRDHGFLSMIVAKGAITGLGSSLPLVILIIWVYGQFKASKRLP